jgi:hypothetical protein
LRSIDGDPPAAFLIEHASSARERLVARDLSPMERRRRAQRLGSELGHWTAYALLEALCGKSVVHGAALARERRRRAQRRLAKVLRDRVSRFDEHDVDSMMESIQLSIGEVEQLAAGEDRVLDPLLRRDLDR